MRVKWILNLQFYGTLNKGLFYVNDNRKYNIDEDYLRLFYPISNIKIIKIHEFQSGEAGASKKYRSYTFFNWSIFFFFLKKRFHLTLPWRRPLSYYHIETSPLICRTDQWTGFYMITVAIMKGLSFFATWCFSPSLEYISVKYVFARWDCWI